MLIEFEIMHGLGNRFIIIDRRGQSLPDERVLVEHFKDFDQLLVLGEPHKKSDLSMTIYNRDGSVAESCGNGTRCVAWLEARRQNKTKITIETLGGILPCVVKGQKVEVDMGEPKLLWADIPLAPQNPQNPQPSQNPDDTLAIPFHDIGDMSALLGKGCAVNIGNPHIVFFPQCEDMNAINIEEIGKKLAHHPLFPQGVNISCAFIGDDAIEIKVWERGAGATKACGTAACASFVALCRKYPIMPRSGAVVFKPEGGRLDIAWLKSNNHIVMSGAVLWLKRDEIHVQ